MGAVYLDQLTRDVGSWPEEDQAELADYARVIRARRLGHYVTSDEEKAAIAEAFRQIERGEFTETLSARSLVHDRPA